MKCKELASLLMQHPEADIYMTNIVLDDSGENLMSNIVDTFYCEINPEIEAWEPRDENTHYVLNPIKIISG